MVWIDSDSLGYPLVVVIPLFNAIKFNESTLVRIVDQEVQDISQEAPAS